MTEPGASRWRGLDAFRGLAVAGMLLVNNPGNHDAVYRQLAHSEWHGCTLADLVFPFFLFVVGITTEIKLRRVPNAPRVPSGRRIWRRAAVIFGMGLLLNWFPFYQSGPIAWADHPGFLDRVAERLLVLRIPGVLQRIAIVYLATALIARRASTRTLAAITAVLLLGYWALLTVVPAPGEGLLGAAVLDAPSRTIVAHVDRALFDWSRWGLGNHLWDSALTWDPEGVLSTLPSIATAILGVLLARAILSSRADRRMAMAVGSATVLIGWLWSFAFPLNKALWTSSFVLFTAGVATMLLVAITYLLERSPGAVWAKPLIVFGENPLIAYAGSELARRILHSSIKIKTATGRVGTDEWVVRQLESVGFSPKAASLAWALIFLATWLLALSRLSRRRLFVRA